MKLGEKAAILQKYPDLTGLYIPHRGEIIPWGKGGHALVTSSPREEGMPPLMVISMNFDHKVATEPFEVKRNLLMGPIEATDQTIAEVYLGSRLTAILEMYPEAKEAYESFKSQRATTKTE